MGGTDKNDQMTRLQKCRRHYKWPRRLVMKFFMWAAYNAYVIVNYIKSHTQPGKRTVTFHAFLEQLFEELVANYHRDRSSFGNRRVSDVTNVRRLQRDAFHDVIRPADATTNNRCVVCRKIYLNAKARNPRAKDKDLPKRTKTVYKCTHCDEYLCIGSDGNNHWYDWHHKQQYWH